MNQLRNWWKTDKRYVTAGKALLMAMLPILCCMVYLAMQGQKMGNVFLPGSEWNDELFYFKQVESIVKFGYPQGYFGFNESHALKLSFAAWSPVLVFPWILWGLLFGWNLMSPIICNILLLTIAMFVFVWLVKPTWRQIGILTFLFCLYTPFVRYMLSGMPEIICFSMLIVFYAVAYHYPEHKKTGNLVCLFILAGLLTLMRPYMILFLLLPICLWIRKNRKWGLIGSAAVLAIVGGCYVLIKHYLGAEYFAPLFFTEWITTFFTDGVIAGFRNFFATLFYMGKAFWGHTVEGFRTGLASGAFFGGYLVMMTILLWQTIADLRLVRKNQKQGKGAEETGVLKRLIPEAHLAFCFVGMLFALLLMYKLTEGSKHLLTFMAVGIFVVSLMRTKTFKKAILLGATFAYLYSYMAVDPYDYQVPFAEEERVAQVEYWAKVFDENLTLTDKHVPNYENVIIWVFNDTIVGSGESVNLKWQMLYGAPKGFGISCCMPDYVIANLDSLQSRYLATVAGGEIDMLCAKAGYVEVSRDEDMVLYERYSSDLFDNGVTDSLRD